jgi:tRNA modification GTPase
VASHVDQPDHLNLRGDSATIAAIATGMAHSHAGDQALIRLSGPAVGSIAEHFLSPMPDAARPAATAAIFTLSGDGQHVLRVPVLVMRAFAPRSFTGEETLELIFPSQAHLLQRVMHALCTFPAVRNAQPGEFSARAYLAGKMSLDQAQHIGALIAAQRDDELLAADLLRKGEPGVHARRWAEEIAEVLALIEAGIDFADQDDVVAINVPERQSRINRLISLITTQTAVEQGAAAAARSQPRVVLWGAPNSGKSTLFNALLGRTRAVASPIAGTTRDVLEEEWEVAPGQHVTLADVAGIAEIEPRDPLNALAQQAALHALCGADVVLWCDPHGQFASPGTPAAPAVENGTRIIRIRTMADLPRPAIPTHENLAVCGLDGWHLDQLAAAVDQALAGEHAGLSEGRSAAQLRLIPRHRAAVQSTIRRLIDAQKHASSDEVCATALRSALDVLGEITGDISPDEILGRVFARFCIGK